MKAYKKANKTTWGNCGSTKFSVFFVDFLLTLGPGLGGKTKEEKSQLEI